MNQITQAAADKELIAAARRARQNAYAEESGFRVGAAVRTAEGKIYTGANIENRVYSLTICAERAAIFSAVAAGERELKEIAIIAEGERPVSPCGACRQVMAEFGIERVIMASTDGQSKVQTLAELLPGSFAAEDFCAAGKNT